jgi:hypothetical protein
VTESAVKELFKGLPLWKNKEDVIELDKRFFYLDDENRY